jgi:type I restriction enzyme S subunit
VSKIYNISLGDLLEFQRGYDLPKSQFITGNIPVISSNGILGYHNQAKVKGPGITIGRSGTVGIPNFINENFFPHNTTLFVKNFKNNDPKYIFYLLNTLALNDKSSGSSVPTINRNHLYPLKISAYLDFTYQQKIASVLSALDSKIELNNRINSELEKMAKTLYDYWFVQFDFPDENGKPYKSSGGAMVWNAELKRAIPKGWEVKKMKDFLNVVTGKEDANFAEINGKYPFFTCGEDILKCNEAKFNGKAILIAGNGNFNVKYFDGQFNAYQRTYVLIANEIKYVGIIFRNVYDNINQFKINSNGSIIKFIRKEDVENIKIIFPRDKDNILKILNQNLDLIQKNKLQNQTLANLRNWLLPMLMNGQIKVPF